MADELKWKPIETLDPEEDEEYIVGWDSATVWITRSAWWNDGSNAETFGRKEMDDLGWWSYKHSVTQEMIEPTHWLCKNPTFPNGD